MTSGRSSVRGLSHPSDYCFQAVRPAFGRANRLAVLLVLLLSGFGLVSNAADKIDELTAQGARRADEGRAAQNEIDRISERQTDLLAEYRTVTKTLDGLKVYNALLQKQIDQQLAQMAELEDSIQRVSIIERQIVPLMVNMVDSLEQFIGLDLPFLLDERTERVAGLREMLAQPDIEVPDKFRRVIEAYEIENEFGRTIEAYRGTLQIEGRPREADFLRIGRLALLFQTVDGERIGMWDRTGGQWRELPRETYKQTLVKGLKIARKQTAPNLLTIPLPAAEEASR